MDSSSNEPQKHICPCFEFSHQDAEALINGERGLSFEAFLEKSGAGTKCTACLLDLELAFVSLTENSRNTNSKSNLLDKLSSSHRKKTDVLSLKQRVYKLVDSISPLIQRPRAMTTYHFPIIAQREISQYLWIANRSMLFEGEVCAPSMDVELEVRDTEGTLVHVKEYELVSESQLRVNLSAFLPRFDGNDIVAGSASVYRRARKVGIRGTTRPQTELVCRSSAACVHGQAPNFKLNAGVVLNCRPENERVFLGILNATDKEMLIDISYPVNMDGNFSGAIKRIGLKPRGSTFHEIKLSSSESQEFTDKPYVASWKSESTGKVFLYCGTPDLSKFSIDHA